MTPDDKGELALEQVSGGELGKEETRTMNTSTKPVSSEHGATQSPESGTSTLTGILGSSSCSATSEHALQNNKTMMVSTEVGTK